MSETDLNSFIVFGVGVMLTGLGICLWVLAFALYRVFRKIK